MGTSHSGPTGKNNNVNLYHNLQNLAKSEKKEETPTLKIDHIWSHDFAQKS